MERNFILTTVTVLSVALVLTSCQPSRVYGSKERVERRQPPPRPQRYTSSVSVSLIISPTPGFRMSQYPNGQYYHRSQQGFVYFKGYDNRFYLDRSYMNRVNYNKWEYKEWKRYSKKSKHR